MGTRKRTSDRQGVEAPWSLAIAFKNSLDEDTRDQKTPIVGAEHREGEEESQLTGEKDGRERRWG